MKSIYILLRKNSIYNLFVIDMSRERAFLAVEERGEKRLVLAGGVASNRHLRDAFAKACEEKKIGLYCPPPILCTDNAAMIGAAAYYEYRNGVRDRWDLNAVPNLKLGERG